MSVKTARHYANGHQNATVCNVTLPTRWLPTIRASCDEANAVGLDGTNRYELRSALGPREYPNLKWFHSYALKSRPYVVTKARIHIAIFFHKISGKAAALMD
jgi:hypothetical protein